MNGGVLSTAKTFNATSNPDTIAPTITRRYPTTVAVRGL